MDFLNCFELLCQSRFRTSSKDSGIATSAGTSLSGSPTKKQFPLFNSGVRQPLPIPDGFPLSASFFDFLNDDDEFGEGESPDSMISQDGLDYAQQSVLLPPISMLPQTTELWNSYGIPQLSCDVSFYDYAGAIGFQQDPPFRSDTANVSYARAITKKTNSEEGDFVTIYQLDEGSANLHFMPTVVNGESNDIAAAEVQTATDMSAQSQDNGNFHIGVWTDAPKKKRASKKPIENECAFCRNNNKPFGHRLKNARGDVVCPVLFKMKCPTCDATGRKAHTQRHCPTAELIKMRQLERGYRHE